MTGHLLPPRGLIVDFDGVFYQYGAGFDSNVSAVAVHAACTQEVLPYAKAELLAEFSSHLDPHHSSHLWQQKHGFDRLRYHHDYHNGIDIEIPAIIDQQQEAVPVFNALVQLGVPMVIVTHASRLWVERVSAHINFVGVPDSHLIALEDVDFAYKHSDDRSIRQAAQILGVPHAQIGMIEDSARNLVYAHQLGMITGLVHYGPQLPPQAEHVTVQASSVAQLVQRLGFNL